MKPRRSTLELDIATIALAAAVVAVFIASGRMNRQSDDLETAAKQLRQLASHNQDQAAEIADLRAEVGVPKASHFEDAIRALERQLQETWFELDEPAGADVDLRRGVPGEANPALLEPPGPGDEIVLPGPEAPE